jgi:hypothetical protein
MITASTLGNRHQRESIMRSQTWALGGVLVILLFIWL